MKAIRIGLVLIGLCGLMLGQGSMRGDGAAGCAGCFTSTGTLLSSGTGTLTIANGGTFSTTTGSWLCSAPDGTVVRCGGGDTETRSAKVPGPTLKEVKSSAHKIPAGDIPPASYMKTAKAISLKSPAIEEAELAQIIVDHGFSIYDYSKVDSYLYHAALKQGTQVRWVWKPMRDADMKAVEGQSWQTFDGMGRISRSNIYAKAIPERILAKAECLLTELPDAILLVSDYEVVKPDPFLAVTTPRMLQAHRIFIVDQWDEPGFTDKPIVEPYEDVVPVTQTIKSEHGSLPGYSLGYVPIAGSVKRDIATKKQTLSGN